MPEQTPLEAIRAAGLDADIHRGYLRIWPKEKFTEDLYNFVTANQDALALEVVAEFAEKRPELDPCGFRHKGLNHTSRVTNEYLWQLSDTIREQLNCPPRGDWRPAESSYGRAAGYPLS